MLQPKKEKFRRQHRNRGFDKGVSHRGTLISFGEYALKAETSGEITSRQIEAARRAMTRFTKRGGKIWINIFPHKSLTKKASEVPMGSGKGSPEKHVAVVLPGRIMFEMSGVPEEIARQAMTRAAHKLPVKCKFITKNDF